MLTINYARSYKKLNKKEQPIVVFIYLVSGDEKALEKYKELSAEHYREDEHNKPIYFSTRYLGEKGSLIVTTKNKIVPDTSEFDKAISIVQQYGGNLGAALASGFAAKLIGTMPVSADPVATNEPIDSLE